jgi:hypothetical protein
MSNSVNDIPVGLRIPSQIPLDAKVYKLSQADLAYLGPSSNLAYTYFKGMIAYCALEETRWEWREPNFVGEVGLLPTNFLYPSNLIIFGIDYSQKAYNFFPFITSTPGATGPTGATGPMGPAGVAGPVGPAGLNWQGSWSAAGTYVVDDAVGYGGASWFCIANVGPTATTPNLDPTKWALLASQGAPGPMGPQGLPGTTPVLTQGTISTATNTIPYDVMPYDINVSLLPALSDISLPTSSLVAGKEVYIQAINAIKIYGNPSNSSATQIFDVSGGSSTYITTAVGAFYKFTYLGVLSIYSPGARWVYQKLNQ